MKLTIIIPTLNAEEKLHITLDSLVKQTYQDFECIIMDGNSRDQTSEIVKTYHTKIPNLQFHSASDRGIYDAMNKGVALSTGEYILFLGAGDSLYNNKVLEQIHLQLNSAPCDILYGDICFLPNQIVKQPEALSNRYFRSGKMICHQSIIARKETLDNYPFDLKYPFGADRDWLIHTFRNQNTFVHIPVAIADYDTSGYTSLAVTHKAVWMESGKRTQGDRLSPGKGHCAKPFCRGYRISACRSGNISPGGHPRGKYPALCGSRNAYGRLVCHVPLCAVGRRFLCGAAQAFRPVYAARPLSRQ